MKALDDADETDYAAATVKAEWKGEASEVDAQILKFRECRLKANKLLVLAAPSNELAEDGDSYGGFDCVRMRGSDVGTNAQLGCGFYLPYGLRYPSAPESLPSAIVD